MQRLLKYMSETDAYSKCFLAMKVDVADSNKKADYSQEAAKVGFLQTLAQQGPPKD
jgi:hypothetical protein